MIFFCAKLQCYYHRLLHRTLHRSVILFNKCKETLLKEAGINEFIFIVGYLGDKIQDFVKSKYPEIKAHYVHQIDRQGVGHAIRLTRTIVNQDDVFVVLGDTICEYNIQEVVDSPFSMIGVRKVDDPRDFGVAEIGEDGFISRVVEKPQIPKSNMAFGGRVLARSGFRSRFRSCRLRLPLSKDAPIILSRREAN